MNSDAFFTFVLFFLAVPCVSYFFVFLFRRAVLGRGVAVRGVILKNKKAGGGLGGRAQRLSPRCIGCCCICSCCMSCFVLPFFSLFLCFFVSSCCSWKRCSGERSHP